MRPLASVRDEQGVVVRAARSPFRFDPRTLDKPAFPLLSGIDPLDTTIYLHDQISGLMDDIDRCLDTTSINFGLDSLRATKLLCDVALLRPQRDLWFSDYWTFPDGVLETSPAERPAGLVSRGQTRPLCPEALSASRRWGRDLNPSRSSSVFATR